MHITCTIENLPEVERAWDRAHEEVGRGCYLAVKLGTQEAAAEALHVRHWKDRTGDSRKKVRGYVTASGRTGDGYNAEGTFEAAFEHASYLDSGTIAHFIRPKAWGGTKKAAKAQGRTVRGPTDIGTHRVALRWYDAGGNPVFRREVFHPGTKGDGFFAKGVQKCERVMQREVELSVARAQGILDA